MRQLQLQIERDGVSEEELELAKSKVCSQVVRRAERPANRLFSVGTNWIQRRLNQSVKEAVMAYQKLTTADIAASLEQYPLSQAATVFAGPLPPPATAP